MKQFFATAVMISCLSLPASASSIELIDDMVTGPNGTPSIITLGTPVACEDDFCVDATGGDSNLATSSANTVAPLNAAPVRKINFDFARKYPDPATPVPSAAPESESASFEGGPAAAPAAPALPADVGDIQPQPPVKKASASVQESAVASQMTPEAMGARPSNATDGETRGSMQP